MNISHDATTTDSRGESIRNSAYLYLGASAAAEWCFRCGGLVVRRGEDLTAGLGVQCWWGVAAALAMLAEHLEDTTRRDRQGPGVVPPWCEMPGLG